MTNQRKERCTEYQNQCSGGIRKDANGKADGKLGNIGMVNALSIKLREKHHVSL